METCPCCSYPLLRHIRSNRIYWFCSHCRQEMPSLAVGDPVIAAQRRALERLFTLSDALLPNPQITD